ncbi:hypothetical protein JW926_16570 [Candidatus Sumerlaeota bacterium]|nr:hypothetical protein [Candidatus Sumerlaeota bacterium]
MDKKFPIVPNNRTQKRIRTIAIFIGLFCIASFFRYKTRTITDDALITYRYSRNLISGMGLVYNPGEKVLGTTTPLYALVIAGAMLFKSAPWSASLILDCFFITAVFWMIIKLGDHIGDKLWSRLVILLLFMDPLLCLPVGGMETGLFLFLIYASFLSLIKQRLRLSVVFALLALFTRPEGGLALMLVLPQALFDFKNRKLRNDWIKILMIVLIPLACAAIFMKTYYGSLIYQSIKGKHAHTNAANVWRLFFDYFFRRQFFVGERFDIRGVLEWIGFILILLRYPKLRIFVYWFFAYLIFMRIGRAPAFVHYHTPLYHIETMGLGVALINLARLAATGLHKFIEWMSGNAGKPFFQKPPPDSPLLVPFAFFLFICISPVFYDVSTQIFFWVYRSQRPTLECKGYDLAGKWIKNHSEQSDVVMAPEIGYIGYFSERTIFDVMGLVTPEAAGEIGRLWIWDWAVRKNPEYVVYPFPMKGFTELPVSFVNNYEIAQVFIYHPELTVVFRKNYGIRKGTTGEIWGIDPQKSLTNYIQKAN